MLQINTPVRILVDTGSEDTEGFIDIIDPFAFPDEKTPYRGVNRAETVCLG